MKKNNKIGKEIIPDNNIQNIILCILIIAVIATFAIGTLEGKRVLAKNSEDYVAWQNSCIKEEERISNLSIYEKLKEGRDISLLVLGDGVGKSSGDNLEQDPWVDKLAKSINKQYASDVQVTNLSEKGNNIYDGLNEYTLLDKKEFDIVVLCFDKYKEQQFTDSNFRGALEALIRSIKENNPNGDIIVVAQHGVGTDSKTFNAIETLSENYGLDVAELNKVFKESTENLLSDDGIYPTDEGYNKYFETLESIIDNNVESAKDIVTDSEVLNEKSSIFKEQYINNNPLAMSDFNNKGDNIVADTKDSFVEYEANGNIIGLSFMSMPNGGNIEIYVNDALYKKIDTSSEIEKVSSIIILDEVSGKNMIKIVNTEDKPVEIVGVICSIEE